jgi:hypothetical protein
MPFTAEPSTRFLRSAAPSMATAWFIRRGYSISYPTEPCSDDLIADCGGKLHRIQVKSVTVRDGAAWICNLTHHNTFRGSCVYDPDAVDFFFIIDGGGGYHLIPIEDIAGQGDVSLPRPGREIPSY